MSENSTFTPVGQANPLPPSAEFDLSRLTLELIPSLPTTVEKDSTKFVCGHFFDKLAIHGFTRRLTTDEISKHPLITLLHDFKHLMVHGDRGSKATRTHKRKQRLPFENNYCRIGFVYLISQDAETFDLNISFIISTATAPFWTEYDGSHKRPMTHDEIIDTVANFINTYISEANDLIAGASLCEIDGNPVINSEQITTPPQKQI